MVFDLEVSEGQWFPYFKSHVDDKTGEVIYDDPVSDAKVKLRSMQSFFEERLLKRKKISEFVLNPTTRQMERVTYPAELSQIDSKRENEDAWDYAIVAFENFKDKAGKEIPCTRENKLKMFRVPEFNRFATRCFKIIDDSAIQEEKAIDLN